MNTFQLLDLHKTEANIIASETNLSICLRASGFSFALVDKNNFALRTLGEFSADLNGGITQIMMNIKECFRSLGIHIFNFNNIRVVCPSRKCVWVPYKLYDAAKNREYLSVNSPLHSNETIIANVSKKLDAVNVFAFPLHIHSGLKITMPKAAYVSPSQVLTEYAFDKSSLSQDTMILYKQDGFCGFALFKGGEFLLSNDFSCSAAEDMIYFILNTLQQAGMNSGEISLIVTGGTYTEKELSLLSKFIRQVSFADLSKNVRVEAEFNEVDLQRYFMVLA